MNWVLNGNAEWQQKPRDPYLILIAICSSVDVNRDRHQASQPVQNRAFFNLGASLHTHIQLDIKRTIRANDQMMQSKIHFLFSFFLPISFIAFKTLLTFICCFCFFFRCAHEMIFDLRMNLSMKTTKCSWISHARKNCSGAVNFRRWIFHGSKWLIHLCNVRQEISA